MKHDFTCTDGDVILRPMSASDSELYRQLRNLDINRKCFIFSDPITEEGQQKWYRTYLEKPNDYMFSIYNQKGQFLGGAALYGVTETSAEFGRILIDKATAGKSVTGYQVLSILCQFAKDQLQLQTLHLEVFEDNQPAVKTYEKAGFQAKKSYPASNGQILKYMEKNLKDIV